jgi:regulator of sigma E protease
MIDTVLNTFTQLPHYLASFVIVLTVIVFVHEFGHYLVARLCGVKIEVFSIGFGREIFGFNDRAGTRWKFSILPLGGYVKMFGDAGAASTADADKIEAMSAAERKVSFHFQALWKKALIVAAGPAANFLLTIAVFTFFIFTTGLTSTDPVVGSVMKDSAAAEAGLREGDRILSLDGKKMRRFDDITNAMMTSVGKPVTLEVQRQKQRFTLTLTPRMFEDKDVIGNPVSRPIIGITSQKIVFKDVGLTTALAEAVRRTYGLCVASLRVLGQMIAGERSAEELKGPIGIAKLSGDVTQQGESISETARTVLWFIALLSANLGLINLFPIPMLDGGHLAFYAIEGVRGRPMAERFQEFGYRMGVVFIVTLMAFTLFNDLRQLIF